MKLVQRDLFNTAQLVKDQQLDRIVYLGAQQQLMAEIRAGVANGSGVDESVLQSVTVSIAGTFNKVMDHLKRHSTEKVALYGLLTYIKQSPEFSAHSINCYLMALQSCDVSQLVISDPIDQSTTVAVSANHQETIALSDLAQRWN